MNYEHYGCEGCRYENINSSCDEPCSDCAFAHAYYDRENLPDMWEPGTEEWIRRIKSETEFKTPKHGNIDVYKATTRVTFSKEEVEEAIRLYAEITKLNAERINRINNTLKHLCDTMAESIERVTNTLNGIGKDLGKVPVEDIPYLKKQIKHCKNPLEEKALQKRLNAALKKAKGKK